MAARGGQMRSFRPSRPIGWARGVEPARGAAGTRSGDGIVSLVMKILSLALLAGVVAACDHKRAQGPPVPPSPTTPSQPQPLPLPLPLPASGGATDAGVTAVVVDAAASEPAIAMPVAAVTGPLANASTALGLDLYAAASKSTGNIALSPASISLALAMTWAGASGTTATGMQKVLHANTDAATFAARWGTVASALQTPGRGLELRIANRLFGERTQTFEPDFLALTRDRFHAPLEPLDFKGGALAARDRINGWVAEQTHQRVLQLLPVGSPSPDSRLVLVNAIYFLADWSAPFGQRSTASADFHTTARTVKSVPTMHSHGALSAGKSDGVVLAELPYRGDTASMLVVVPTAVDGLPAIEHALSPARLATWRRALKSQDVALALPKFKIDPASSLDLAAALAILGMADAFDPDTADFSKLARPATPKDRLAIGGVYHKAFVKVDETGTEAAAATAVGMPTGGPMPTAPALTITADRPFLFFIIDRQTGLVLFMGRVADPS